jgi:Pectate lyase superfamily protein/Glycosyl hydrolases family 28
MGCVGRGERNDPMWGHPPMNDAMKKRFYLSRLLTVFACAWTMAAYAQTGIRAVAPPSYTQASTVFKVSANGDPILVEHYRDRNIARLSTAQACELTITAPGPIHHFSIHPLSFGLKGTANGNTLTFRVSADQFDPQPAYLLIKIDDLENLVVLVDPPDNGMARLGAGKVPNVTASPFGADATGKVLATKAIQDAVDAASAAGSGVVLVPPGTYTVQSVMLKSGVTLYLAEGAVIRGSTNLADFGDQKLPPAIIQIKGFKDVAIRGRGWIEAGGDAVTTGDGRLVTLEARDDYRRNAIRATDGSGLTIEGITTHDAGTWAIYAEKVDGVHISRVKVFGPMWPTADGIDIGARNAVIEKCLVYTGDDNFVSKASHADFPISNIVFRDSIGYGNSAGVKVGLQVVGAQSNIKFQNIDIIHTGRGLVVEHHASSSEHAPQPIDNVEFTDIRVEQVEGTGGMSRNPIHISSDAPAPISDIRFTRITIGNFGPKPSVIHGDDDGKDAVSNVVFTDLFIGGRPIDSPKAGDFEVDNAKGISFQLTGKAPSK